MSNIYTQEPQAFGHIKFKTTFGDLDIELFTKQCPKATRNFTQLCLDDYYKNTIFDRVEKDFIAIGGSRADQDDDDFFPDEFHSRLRFNRRGLLATANTKKNENGPRFFFTLGSTPELQNKHTIFGRLIGNSIYSLVDLNECQVDEDFTPYSEQKITDIIIIENPYPDLARRTYKQNQLIDPKNAESSDSEVDNPLAGPKVKVTSKKLLYNDSDSDDDITDVEKNVNKSESNITHKESSIHFDEYKGKIAHTNHDVSYEKDDINNFNDRNEVKVNDLKLEHKEERISNNKCDKLDNKPESSSNFTAPDTTSISADTTKEEKLRQIKAQIEALRKEIENQSETKTLKEKRYTNQSDVSLESSESGNYRSVENTQYPRKNKNRERETIELVTNFKKKLKQAAKEGTSHEIKNNIQDSKSKNRLDFDQDELAALDRIDSDEWLRHEFKPEEDGDEESKMAKDANMKDNDWYSIEDPRHKSHYNHHSRKHDWNRDRSRDRDYVSTSSTSRYKKERYSSGQYHNK